MFSKFIPALGAQCDRPCFTDSVNCVSRRESGVLHDEVTKEETGPVFACGAVDQDATTVVDLDCGTGWPQRCRGLIFSLARLLQSRQPPCDVSNVYLEV